MTILKLKKKRITNYVLMSIAISYLTIGGNESLAMQKQQQQQQQQQDVKQKRKWYKKKPRPRPSTPFHNTEFPESANDANDDFVFYRHQRELGSEPFYDTINPSESGQATQATKASSTKEAAHINNRLSLNIDCIVKDTGEFSSRKRSSSVHHLLKAGDGVCEFAPSGLTRADSRFHHPVPVRPELTRTASASQPLQVAATNTRTTRIVSPPISPLVRIKDKSTLGRSCVDLTVSDPINHPSMPRLTQLSSDSSQEGLSPEKATYIEKLVTAYKEMSISSDNQEIPDSFFLKHKDFTESDENIVKLLESCIELLREGRHTVPCGESVIDCLSYLDSVCSDLENVNFLDTTTTPNVLLYPSIAVAEKMDEVLSMQRSIKEKIKDLVIPQNYNKSELNLHRALFIFTTIENITFFMLAMESFSKINPVGKNRQQRLQLLILLEKELGKLLINSINTSADNNMTGNNILTLLIKQTSKSELTLQVDPFVFRLSESERHFRNMKKIMANLIEMYKKGRKPITIFLRTCYKEDALEAIKATAVVKHLPIVQKPPKPPRANEDRITEGYYLEPSTDRQL